MNKGPSFLQHAITAPDFTATKTHRPRLTNELRDNLHRRLILVSAPAGYGKTTFLADFTEHSSLPIPWLRLTEAGSDAMRLAVLVWESLCRRFHRLRGKVDWREQSGSTARALARVLTRQLTKRVSEDFVLVLDDVHRLGEQEAPLAFIAELIEGFPPNGTLVLAGREVPQIPLVQWIARDELKTFGAEELALDLDEVREIASSRLGRTLAEEEANRLLETSGGWVTGVLLSEALAGDGLPELTAGEEPLAYDFLAEAVFSRQPEEVRRFLLRSSALPVLTAESCQVALGWGDARGMLTYLVRKSLFLSVTGLDPRTYEFHPLFRGFLLNRLAGQEPEALREIRLRAAEYFEAEGWPEVAFDLLMAAEEIVRAAELADASSWRLHEEGMDDTILRWADELWQAGAQAPEVYRRAALVCSARGVSEQTDAWLERALDSSNSTGREKAKFYVLASTLYISLSSNQLSGWRSILAEMDRLAKELGQDERAELKLHLARYRFEVEKDPEGAIACLDEAIRDGDPILKIRALNDKVLVEGSRGNLHTCDRSVRRAVELMESHRLRGRRIFVYNNLGTVSHLRGRYMEAMDSYQLAMESARAREWPRQEALCHLGIADLLNDLGLREQAREKYSRVVRTWLALSGVQLLDYAVSMWAASFRRAGLYDDALTLLETHSGVSGCWYWGALGSLERAAARWNVEPSRLESFVKKLQDAGKLNAVESTLGSLLVARSYAATGADEEVMDWGLRALDEAWRNKTIQVLAAELLEDHSLRHTLTSSFPDHSSVYLLDERIEAMLRAREWIEPRKETTVQLQVVSYALGRIALLRNGNPVRGLRPGHRLFLFYLLDAQSADSEQVGSAFWHDATPDEQAARVHTAVYQIRLALGEKAVVRNGGRYSVGANVLAGYDVNQFEQAANIAAHTTDSHPGLLSVIHEALSLYGGEFLLGYDADWILRRRAELERRYLGLAARMANVALNRGQAVRALPDLERARMVDPIDEQLLREHLKLLHSLGRTGDLKIAYTRFAKRLAEELQLKPSEESELLFRSLSSQSDTSHPLLAAFG